MSAQTRDVHLWTSQQGNFLTKCTGRLSWKMVIRKFCETCDYYAVLDGCVARKQVQFYPITNTA